MFWFTQEPAFLQWNIYQRRWEMDLSKESDLETDSNDM